MRGEDDGACRRALAYGVWNPFVRRLSGELTEGAKLTVEIAPPGGRAMTFKPTVVAAEEGRATLERTRLGFEQMNGALKRRAEAAAGN